MAEVTVSIGETGFTEMKPRDRWTSTGGWVTVRTWTGATSGVSLFLRNQLPAGYTALDVDRSGPLAQVSADYPFSADPGDAPEYRPDPIVRSWQLVSSREEISIWSLPKVVRAFQLVPEEHRAPLTRWINDCLDYGLPVTSAFPSSGSPPIPASGSSAPNRLTPPFNAIPITQNAVTFNSRVLADLYERLHLNRDAHPVIRYVLRKADTLGSYSAIKAAHANVMRMFTLVQLKAAEPTLTADVQVEINAAGLTKYYWLKGSPNLEPVQNGLRQLTQEYEAYALFDDFIYQRVGEPDEAIVQPITRRT